MTRDEVSKNTSTWSRSPSLAGLLQALGLIVLLRSIDQRPLCLDELGMAGHMGTARTAHFQFWHMLSWNFGMKMAATGGRANEPPREGRAGSRSTCAPPSPSQRRHRTAGKPPPPYVSPLPYLLVLLTHNYIKPSMHTRQMLSSRLRFRLQM
jgi:hypothetical protein